MTAPHPDRPLPAAAKNTAVTMPKALARFDGGAESRRLAAAILEVLAGVRTTVDAAKALSVSLPRYYALEARAIEGLVRACEPRKRGPGRSQAKELETLCKEKMRLERECARQQALARAAQRTLGLAPPPSRPAPDAADKGKKRRKRRPVARALLAATTLRRSVAAPPPSPPPSASPSPGRGTP